MKTGWLLEARFKYRYGTIYPRRRLLIKLTSSYPKKKKYWKQLSAIYLNINKDDRALATLDLAYKLDFLEKETGNFTPG